MSSEKHNLEATSVSVAPRKLDLSRIRHDLRTPINHILGYCEMLIEEESVPRTFLADLQKIHTGGRQLVSLINEYFDDETFETKARDLHQLCHELRTPVNHIIGYSEILQEHAEEIGREKFIPDLKKIHEAATTWLALMEEHLMMPGNAPLADGSPPAAVLSPGVTFQIPVARNIVVQSGALLVVDDDEANREMLARRLRRDGYTVTLAASGLEALKLLRMQPFDLVLLDLLMPGLDGYQVLLKVKADLTLRDVPVIMISALDQEDGVARCIELGAEDYLAKPFNPVFLRARIGAGLEKKRLREQERATFEALRKSEQRLAAELAEAAAYVRSLLPPPLDGDIRVDWRFIPCAELGGDVFSYYALDEDHFAMFIVDVCGHGVSAAMFSVSIFNVLRSRSLPDTNFLEPGLVLARLNERFPMEHQNNMYFTIWYGVFNRRTSELAYASGGHPPAILLRADSPPQLLRTPGMIVGFMADANFQTARCNVPGDSQLILLSDGAYEIARPGTTATLEEFVAQLTLGSGRRARLDDSVAWARQIHGGEKFDDDLSLVEITF
jgi:phosphoserine phosphatase RsbU/P